MSPEIDADKGRVAWALGGLVLALSVAFVVYTFVGTFVFGLFIYYATRPVYDRLETRIESNSIAAATALLTLVVPIILLFAYTLVVGLREFREFSSDANLGQYEQTVKPYLEATAGVRDPSQLLADPGAVLSSPGIRAALSELVGPLVDSIGIVGNGLIHLFVMLVLAYYLLKDGRRLSRWVHGKFADDRGVMDAYFSVVDRDFRNIFFGSILNAFLASIIAGVSYAAVDAVAPAGMGVPYPVLVGLLTGVGSLIPAVGMKIVYVPVAIYLGATTYLADPGLLWFPALFVVVSLVVVDLVPDLVLRPYVAGRELHLGAVMLAYTLGPLIWGWYGVFLGPVILVLVVHFAKVVLPELIAERSLSPYSIDPTYLTEPTPAETRSEAVVGDGGPETDDSPSEDPTDD